MISTDSIQAGCQKSTAFIVDFEQSNIGSSSNTTSANSSTTLSSPTMACTNNTSNYNSNLQDAFMKYREEKIVSSFIFTLMPSLPDSIRNISMITI